MDLIEGEDLGQLASRLSSSEVVRLCLRITEALQVAHTADVIHCDLKPTNVLLQKDGQPVIVDFGLARAVQNKPPLHAVAGTAPWMATEQVEAEFGAVTERTDVYGIGALMYTLLTGSPPYLGRRAVDVLSQIISSAVPAAIVASNSDADPKLVRLVGRCMEQHPGTRPPKMSDVVSALEEIAADETIDVKWMNR